VVRPLPDRRTGGLEALEDRPSRPSRVWNHIPDEVREKILQLALDEPEFSPRELAVRFTDQQSSFISEASVYRLLRFEVAVLRSPDSRRGEYNAVEMLGTL
jgi:hypothetical protein